MNPETAGEYLLRFQRQNPVDQATELSLVRVVVAERASFSTTSAATAAALPTAALPTAAFVADSAASAASLPAASLPAAATTSLPTAAAAVSVAAASAAALVDPASLIKLAKAELEAKRIQTAIEALDRYLTLYPYGNDELFYLYGLASEQDTPFRNIRKAWEFYKRVKDEYPRSAWWAAASERIAYLERHYFGLR